MKSIYTAVLLCFLMTPIAIKAQPQQSNLECGLYELDKCSRSTEPVPSNQTEEYWKKNGHKFCEAEWKATHGPHPDTQGNHRVRVIPFICRTKVTKLSEQSDVTVTCAKEKHNMFERAYYRDCCPVNKTPKEATDVDVRWYDNGSQTSNADTPNNSSVW